MDGGPEGYSPLVSQKELKRTDQLTLLLFPFQANKSLDVFLGFQHLDSTFWIDT